MKKINYTLILAFIALSSLFTACQRDGDMPDRTDANSTVDHLIFKEVFYIGYCTYRDLSSMGFKSQYSRYEDANYIVIYNPTNQPISLANMALACHVVDPSIQYSFQKDGNGDFIKRYYGIGGMSYFPNDPVTKKPHVIQPGDSVIVVKYACDHNKKFLAENETTEEEAKKNYYGWEALPDYSKLPKDKTFELCNQHSPKNGMCDPNDKFDNKDIPNMRDLVLWDGLPFKGPSQSMRMALVKLPDGDASKPHTKDENGFYPDESPRSRNNWYQLYDLYGTEQDQINDETDPLKKRELEKNRKYPTAYYHIIYNTTGMAGVNAIELNYNWVVDFLTICPSTEKKMDLLTGPSSVTVYDATGHAVMEGTEEKKEKVWWYDRGTASVCKRIFGINDFSNPSFDPSELQGALIRRSNGKGFVAEMSSALNYTKGVPSLCRRDSKGKPLDMTAYWKVNSINARTKKK